MFGKHTVSGSGGGGDNGYSMSLRSSLSSNSSSTSHMPRSISDTSQYQSSQFSGYGSQSSERLPRGNNTALNSSYSSSMGSPHIRSIASMDMYRQDQCSKLGQGEIYPEGTSGLLSGILMQGSGSGSGSNLVGQSGGARETFLIPDRFSHSLMDSDVGMSGGGGNSLFDVGDLEYRDGVTNGRQIPGKDIDPFGGGIQIQPPPGVRSFLSQGSDSEIMRGFNLNR